MKTKLLITFIAISEIANAQGSWTQKANFGGTGRAGAVAFSIGTKGYIGTGTEGGGSSGPNKNDFWEWDQLTDTWTQRANFAGTARSYAVGFSIGTKGYIGTGYDGTDKKNDFWEWNQSNNTWIQKASFGGTARYCAVGFSINTKGYIGTGYDDNNGSTKKDFWEWDQASDTWTQKANLGGSVRGEAIGFSIGSKGYIGTGNDSSALLKKDFLEWDQTTDVWTPKADFGGTARRNALGFSIGTKGYIGTGTDGNSDKDFWEWDQSNNTWSQKTNFGGTSRSQSIGFSIGAKGYIGTGGNATKDFWEFDPTVTGINEVNLDNLISVYPNPASDFATISIDNVNNVNTTLNIYSIKGELIRTETLQPNQKQINVKDLSTGIYTVELKSKEGSKKQKIVIQR